MKDLEQADYNETLGNENKPRLFSKRVANIIGFARIHTFDKTYKIVLDDWARHIVDSPYRYDYIRFIMRELRKKNNLVLEDKETINKLDTPTNPNDTFYVSSHDDEDHEQENFLYDDEYKEMYGEEDAPKGVAKSSIHLMGTR